MWQLSFILYRVLAVCDSCHLYYTGSLLYVTAVICIIQGSCCMWQLSFVLYRVLALCDSCHLPLSSASTACIWVVRWVVYINVIIGLAECGNWQLTVKIMTLYDIAGGVWNYVYVMYSFLCCVVTLLHFLVCHNKHDFRDTVESWLLGFWPLKITHLNTLFWFWVTGSYSFGWDHMAGESAFHTILLC